MKTSTPRTKTMKIQQVINAYYCIFIYIYMYINDLYVTLSPSICLRKSISSPLVPHLWNMMKYPTSSEALPLQTKAPDSRCVWSWCSCRQSPQDSSLLLGVTVAKPIMNHPQNHHKIHKWVAYGCITIMFLHSLRLSVSQLAQLSIQI